MVRAAGVEPTTFGFGGRRSIQLSYARNVPTLAARKGLLNVIPQGLRLHHHHFTTKGRLSLWLLNSGAYMHWICATPV
jgi:hypothetical protein